VPVETWYHLAYVYEGMKISNYVNGTLTAYIFSDFASSTTNSFREPNFIGMGETEKSIYVSNTVIDDIKLFNKALTQQQIMLDMNASHGIASGIC
jgi:hypothetical protein